MHDTTTNHTPGPWRTPYLDSLPDGLRAWRVDSAQPAGVAVVALCYVGDAEITAIQEANARLIAAAPELLECLLMALPFVEDALDSEDFKPSYVRHRADLIRAAINKATGGDK
jgi:hypothetical protein